MMAEALQERLSRFLKKNKKTLDTEQREA